VRVRLWVLLLWGCFVLRGAFYVCSIPLWEGFDEYAHYARIEYLSTLGREPLRTTAVPEDIAETMAYVPTHNGGMSFDEYWRLTPAERKTPLSPPAAFIYEAQQPPLFYWLSSAFYHLLGKSPLVSRVIFLRMLCVLLASFCVPIGFLIGRQVFGNPILALSSTTLIAALPLLTYTATHISNDGLAIGLGTLVVLLVLRRKGVALAAALGAALLTKAYFLAFLPPVNCPKIGCRGFVRRRSDRRLVVRGQLDRYAIVDRQYHACTAQPRPDGPGHFEAQLDQVSRLRLDNIRLDGQLEFSNTPKLDVSSDGGLGHSRVRGRRATTAEKESRHRAFDVLAQNGARREAVLDRHRGARRTLRASRLLPGKLCGRTGLFCPGYLRGHRLPWSGRLV
jgi:hypothetical protein